MTYPHGTGMYSMLYNDYNFPQSGTRLSSETYPIPLKVCRTERNKYNLISIDIWTSETIKELKEKIAIYLLIDVPINEFFLEIFDEYRFQWKRIDDWDSSITINRSGLRPGDILSIGYDIQPVSSKYRPLYSPSSSMDNQNLILKLCKIPMERTDFINLIIPRSSTLWKLRKQAYEQLYKSPSNQSIYLLKDDNWIRFESDMDESRLNDLGFRSFAFISTEPDEETFNSKLPSGICGLANLGSTCYMNSVFQCLSNTPEFTKKVLGLTEEVNAPIIDQYRQLMKKVWSGNYKTLDPTSLVNNIQDNLPRYTNYRQQDAQEFMNHFLHLIHAELSSKKTLITDFFYGQMQSTVRCLECHRTEITNESISFLPLPISNYNQKTILYVKTSGEHHRVSVHIDASVLTLDDLIRCFLTRQESALTPERIRAVQLVNNCFKLKYDTQESVAGIREEELTFLECPEKSTDQKYILCEFVDYSTGTQFRPPTVLVCPTQNCHYTDLSDQIDELLGHLCSVTNTPPTDCQLFWKNENKQRRKLSAGDNLPSLSEIIIEMSAKWVDVYKVYSSNDTSNDKSALTSLLADFFREEPLDGDYHCLQCPKLTKARQKSSLCPPLPLVLIIQLKRFTYNIYSNDKIDTYISFPLYGLDLNEYISKDKRPQEASNKSTKYNLVAVSNHSGSLMSGHYTTYAKNVLNGNWYLFDDRFVKKVDNENDVVTKNAYILIYVRAI